MLRVLVNPCECHESNEGEAASSFRMHAATRKKVSQTQNVLEAAHAPNDIKCESKSCYHHHEYVLAFVTGYLWICFQSLHVLQ